MSRTIISNKELDITESDLGMDPDDLLGTPGELEDVEADEAAERSEREERIAPDLPDRAFDKITPQV